MKLVRCLVFCIWRTMSDVPSNEEAMISRLQKIKFLYRDGIYLVVTVMDSTNASGNTGLLC